MIEIAVHYSNAPWKKQGRKCLLFYVPSHIIGGKASAEESPSNWNPLLVQMMKPRCYYYDVSALSSAERFEQALASLPWEERREKILRYRFEKDRRLSLGAGLLAAYALREAGAEDLALQTGEYGKPELLFYPNIRFNLSHSGTLAVCAVSDRPVVVYV